MKTTIFIISCILLVGVAIVNAGTKKEEYELQERCGKRADELFKQDFGNGTSHDDTGTYMHGYTNHYSNKLNKCFYLLKTTFIPNERKKESILRMESLFDINENKEYGTFARFGKNKPTQCYLLSNFCESEAQWILLVKPYMEE